MAKWEYKFVVGDARKIEKEINNLAGDGWEPISMSDTWANAIVLLRRALL